MYFYVNGIRKGIGNYFPISWKSIGIETEIAFSVFEVVAPQNVINLFTELNIIEPEFAIHLVKGVLEYPPKHKFISFPGETVSGNIANLSTNNSLFLLVFLKSESRHKSTMALEAEINSYGVLLSLLVGRNLIIKHIITNSTTYKQIDNSKYEITGNVIGYPLDYEHTGSKLGTINKEQFKSIIKIAITHQNSIRIIRSANWYLNSFKFENVDSFLAKWISLETLCMKQSSNIKPIKNILAKRYNETEIKINEIFCIGRIYDFRNEIVHNGYIFNLEIWFLTFMDLIIEDCLTFELGIETEPKALKYLKQNQLDINNYVLKVKNQYLNIS